MITVYSLFEVQISLITFKLFLVSNVPPYSVFVQTHGADTIAGGPKMQTRHPAMSQQFAVDTHGTLALQKADRMGDTVLGRDAQTQDSQTRYRLYYTVTNPTKKNFCLFLMH